MGDFEKVIDVCVQAPKITEEILKSALRDLMSGKKENKGNITFNELALKAGGKIDAIEITESNIKSFLSVAQKYDIDFSLKRDSSTEPPTYHCFFATKDTDNFKRAFTEYAANVQSKAETRYTVPRSQIAENARRIAKEQNEKDKEKVRSRQKEQNKTEAR